MAVPLRSHFKTSQEIAHCLGSLNSSQNLFLYRQKCYYLFLYMTFSQVSKNVFFLKLGDRFLAGFTVRILVKCFGVGFYLASNILDVSQPASCSTWDLQQSHIYTRLSLLHVETKHCTIRQEWKLSLGINGNA